MDNKTSNNEINKNIFKPQLDLNATNPFGNDSSILNNPINAVNPINNVQVKRINGYDANMLNNTHYNNGAVHSDELSLEYQIKEKESIINDLTSKIKQADNYGTINEALTLKAKRQRIKQEIEQLKIQQLQGTSFNITANSAFTHNTFKNKMPILYKIHEFVSRQILSKISKKVNSVVTLSDSLEQLEQISKSVDELIDLNVPYGEKIENYEKLTEYLNQANIIHSKISKTLHKK